MLAVVCVAFTALATAAVSELFWSRYYRKREEKMRAAFSVERETWNQMSAGDLVHAIWMASRERNFDNIHRRMIKLMEELGEASEAYLNATSATNGKGKTFADVREELADCVIVAVDLALTPTPDQVDKASEDIEREFLNTVGLKLMKWMRNRATGIVATDAE
jgi:NTP pyrophosphatase (non-canonical NTP hydrolase)